MVGRSVDKKDEIRAYINVTGIPIFWPYPKFTVDTYLVDIGDQP